MIRPVKLFLFAVQFLTRLPVGSVSGAPADLLGEASVFFPLVGLLVAAGGVALNHLLSPWLGRNILVILVLLYFVLFTGGLHEDGLADTADGFGGGWRKDQILTIMRDSRIGSFGATAIVFSILARYVCLQSLNERAFDQFLVAGQVLNRWTALPLGFLLRSAREDDGQGARVAEKVSRLSLILGTAMTVVIVGLALGREAVWILCAVMAVTTLAGVYFWRRIGGVTGDCMGATNQVVEVTVYFMGALLR